MTDTSEDSVQTVISALDSRSLQTLCPEDNSPNPTHTDCIEPAEAGKMGNRFGGEKKKDSKPEKKAEDKSKKKGKKSKNRWKRNSRNVEDVSSHMEGACALPASLGSQERSTRPDVLADLGVTSAGPSLASPTSSQCTWSYDEESDVSTLGYSTPLSTPQIHRYVMPKQSPPQQQTSTERLVELSRSIERTIIDNLSDRPPVVDRAVASPASTSEMKTKRNVKKKRVLGQAVIDSDVFTLPIPDAKSAQSSGPVSDSQKLNVDNKICLRESRESPVSAWLRDDDTPIDEEQMDEMFISCIDLSYNLAGICSEKEFIECSSLESRNRVKSERSRYKDASLSPCITRRPLDTKLPERIIPQLKVVNSRQSPSKSDSSTSTLEELELDTETSHTAQEDVLADTAIGNENPCHHMKKTKKSRNKNKSKKKKKNIKDTPMTTKISIPPPSEQMHDADDSTSTEVFAVDETPGEDTITHINSQREYAVSHSSMQTDHAVPHNTHTEHEVPHSNTQTEHEVPHINTHTECEVPHINTHTEPALPHRNTHTEPALPHRNTQTEHDVNNSNTQTDHEVPHNNTQTYHEVPHNNTQTEHEVPHINTQTERKVPHINTQTEREVPHINRQTEHEVPHINIQTEREVPHINTQAEHEVPHNNTQTEHEVLHINTQTEHEVPHINIQTEREVPHINTQTEREVPHINRQTEHEVPHINIQTEREVPHINTQAEHEVPHNNTQIEHALPHRNTHTEHDGHNSNTQAEHEVPHSNTQAEHEVPHSNTQAEHEVPHSNTQAEHEVPHINTETEHAVSHSNTQTGHGVSHINIQTEHGVPHSNTQTSNEMSHSNTQTEHALEPECLSHEVSTNVANKYRVSDLLPFSRETLAYVDVGQTVLGESGEGFVGRTNKQCIITDNNGWCDSLAQEGHAQLSNTASSIETDDNSASVPRTYAGDDDSREEQASLKHVPPPSPSAMISVMEVENEDEDSLESMESDHQLKEVQLFGEIVFKRLSSLMESQSQSEDDRLDDFRDRDGLEVVPVDFESLPSIPDVYNASTGSTPTQMANLCCEKDSKIVVDVMNEQTLPSYCLVVERSIIHRPTEECNAGSSICVEVLEDEQDVDSGTLKRKTRKKKHKHDQKNLKTDGSIVRKPDIPSELKQMDSTRSHDGIGTASELPDDDSVKNIQPKRESQQIKEIIDLYGTGDIVGAGVDCVTDSRSTRQMTTEYQPDSSSEYDSDDISENDPRSSGRLEASSILEQSSWHIPPIEETFNELLSVKHILDDFEDRTPTEESFPSFLSAEAFRSPPECGNWRRSRMSPAVTDRTESDLDVSEQRDDISTDSMYADDEDDGVSEVLLSRSYSEPEGNEVVVSCTFYNTQHSATDSDDFWENYATADESFKQIELSADAASATFQNARKQMQDIHMHLQDLRRQMELLQDEVEHVTLSPDVSVSPEEKRLVTE